MQDQCQGSAKAPAAGDALRTGVSIALEQVEARAYLMRAASLRWLEMFKPQPCGLRDSAADFGDFDPGKNWRAERCV
jgi:hypothetical protein